MPYAVAYLFVMYDDHEFLQKHSRLLILFYYYCVVKETYLNIANFVPHLRMVLSTCWLRSGMVWVCVLRFPGLPKQGGPMQMEISTAGGARGWSWMWK